MQGKLFSRQINSRWTKSLHFRARYDPFWGATLWQQGKFLRWKFRDSVVNKVKYVTGKKSLLCLNLDRWRVFVFRVLNQQAKTNAEISLLCGVLNNNPVASVRRRQQKSFVEKLRRINIFSPLFVFVVNTRFVRHTKMRFWKTTEQTLSMNTTGVSYIQTATHKCRLCNNDSNLSASRRKLCLPLQGNDWCHLESHPLLYTLNHIFFTRFLQIVLHNAKFAPRG